MAPSIITKRLVFCIGGFDPWPPQAAHRRFVRELQRFKQTWSVTATVSEPEIETDTVTWNVVTEGPNWRVDTRYHFVRWDDVMDAIGCWPAWRRILFGLWACLDFIAGGALFGYLRTSWRYAIVFLYPILLVAGATAVAWLVYLLAAAASGTALAGAIAGLLAFVALLYGASKRLFLMQVLDGWIFSRAYVRRGDPVLEPRIERVAQAIVAAARRADADEILIVGHSLGSVLAIDLIDRALRLEPGLCLGRTPIAFLSIGSSILKIGLHRGAGRFRAAVGRVALAPGLFWAEYQALVDVMNFYRVHPVTALGLPAEGRPVMRVVYLKKMLAPDAYRRLRRNFFRIHNQFISGNDRRAEYDYFMIVCGPLSLQEQFYLKDGAEPEIAADGTLLRLAGGEQPAHEDGRRLARQ